MISWNDRRTGGIQTTSTDKANVVAAAKAGSIKATEKPDTKKDMFRVNKPMTRLVAGTSMVGRNVKVKPGSKKEARLQKRQDWAESYGDEQSKKFDAQMKKEKTRREAGK
jgi:hypothetical protein